MGLTSVLGVGFGLSSNGVRLGDVCCSMDGQGSVLLGEGVVPQDPVVELLLIMNVQVDPRDLADGLIGLRLVVV